MIENPPLDSQVQLLRSYVPNPAVVYIALALAQPLAFSLILFFLFLFRALPLRFVSLSLRFISLSLRFVSLSLGASSVRLSVCLCLVVLCAFPFVSKNRQVASSSLLTRIASAFAELHELYEEGTLLYPYSTREMVHIVKHLSKYPGSSVSEALRNVLDFDATDANVLAIITGVLSRHGIPLLASGEGGRGKHLGGAKIDLGEVYEMTLSGTIQ